MIKEWKIQRLATGEEETISLNTDPVAIKGPKDITNMVQYGVPDDAIINIGTFGPFVSPNLDSAEVVWGMVNYVLAEMVYLNQIKIVEEPDHVYDVPFPPDVVV